MTSFRVGSVTDVGMVRETNQDSFLVDEPLFAVADGMGGHQGGEVASATALEILHASFQDATKDDFLEAVRRANAKVWDKGQLNESLTGMGTTLTAVAAISDEDGKQTLALVNVGDSRGYLFRDGEMSQITTDHSLVEEMIRAGEITADEAETHPRRNIVTRALGVEPTVEADIFEIDPQPGDRVLLCSDGLTREVTDNQIAAVLRRLRNPEEAARELVSQAKAHGGHDNITVVIVDVEDDGVTPTTIAVPDRKAKKRSKVKAPKAQKTGGRLTFRTLLFFAAVLALIGVACGSVVWYARSSYSVGLEGQQLVIYKGRPEPVLWFEKTLLLRTNINTSQVPETEVARLQGGVAQSSRTEAEQYIQNLVTQRTEAMQAALPPNSPSIVPPVVGPGEQTTIAPLAPPIRSVDPNATTTAP